MDVTLTPQMNDFIRRQLESGRYRSASDVVREALALLEERDRRMAALKSAIQQGLNSGEATPLDFNEIKRKGRERLQAMGG